MKTKLLLFCVMLSIAAVNSFGQVQNFDISKYKLADYKRQSLDFNFNMLGQSDIRNDKSDFSTFKSSTDEFSSSFNLNYNYYLNTRKNQKYIGVYGSVNPYNYYYSNTSNSTYSKQESASTSANVSFQFNNSHYVNNSIFYKIGFYTHDYINRNEIEVLYRDPYTQGYNNKSIGISSNNSLLVGLGLGRIESVGDAQLAVFVLSDLLKNNSLTRDPSEEEIMLFAQKITKLKNLRSYDYRLRRIYEMQAIDTFLQSSNLISKSDVIYFTTLNDSWAYSNNYYRPSGYELSLNFRPMFTYYENRKTGTYTETYDQKIFGIDIYGEFTFAQPINFKWQQYFSLALDFIRQRNSSNNHSNITSNDLRLSTNYKLGFYPNSRTFVEAYIEGAVIKRKYDEEQVSDYNLNGQLESGLLLYYYISERIKLTMNADIRYSQYNYPEDQYMQYQKNLKPYVKLDFNYALF